MSMTRTLLAGAALALAVTLGASAPALADFDHDRRWAPSPPPAQTWHPRRPPAVGHHYSHGWVWVCRRHECGWVRDMRRHSSPHYAQPAPRHRLPPIAWQPPLGAIHLQLDF